MLGSGIGSGLADDAASQINRSADIAHFLMEQQYPTNFPTAVTSPLKVGEHHAGDVAEPAERSVKKARVVAPRAGEAIAAMGGGVEQEHRAAGRSGGERQMRVLSSGGGEGAVGEGGVHLAPDELVKERYLKRLKQNHALASGTRVRRKEYVQELEDKLAGVKAERHTLKGQVDSMRSENRQLEVQMKNLQERR